MLFQIRFFLLQIQSLYFLVLQINLILDHVLLLITIRILLLQLQSLYFLALVLTTSPLLFKAILNHTHRPIEFGSLSIVTKPIQPVTLRSFLLNLHGRGSEGIEGVCDSSGEERIDFGKA